MGRPEELGRWGAHIARQTVEPAASVFAVTSDADLPASVQRGFDVSFSAPGSCRQRNAGLEFMKGRADIIAFFDDDYIPSSYCIEGIAAFFTAYPDVVAANGTLLADGINSPGIPYADALTMVRDRDSLRSEPAGILSKLSGLYGCNMAFRASAIGDERFDERLPLYGWQEDIDFAARVGRHGAIVKTDYFYGVHQGVKKGRTSGVRLGYSQVANPLYLIRKGTMRASEALPLMLKNILKNHARAFAPEPWVDRVGRCRGNWLAVMDVLRRRDDPGNIVSM